MSGEDTFQSWAKPPGETEQAKCDNAERAIRKAIDSSAALKGRTAVVLPQGSYRNRTNVRMGSDVDICVICWDSIFFDVPEGKTAADYGIKMPSDYPYAQFKKDVGAALASYLAMDQSDLPPEN